MEFDDEALLSPAQYGQMARAYASELKNKGFLFVSLNEGNFEKALKDVFDVLSLLRDNLLALRGFLGTGALYNLNEKQILFLEKLFAKDFIYKKQNLINDKTKLFLNMLSLENTLIGRMIDLALSCDKAKEIFDLIKERTALCGSLFRINGIISTYFQ